MTLYTTSTCKYCTHVKKYLDRKGAKYSVIDVTDDLEKRNYLHRTFNALTVPILVKSEQEFVIGPNWGKIAQIL